MPFEPLRVTTADGSTGQRLYPAVDAAGEPLWESGDTNAAAWRLVGLGTCQGGMGNERRHQKIDARIYVTDARVIVVSGHFAQGTHVSGPLISSAILNKMSQDRAEREAAGKFLVGQMRHPWISGVVYSRRTGRRGDSSIRVCGTHQSAFGDQEPVILIAYLDAYGDPHEIAGAISSRVIADRRDWTTTTEPNRASLDGARFTDPAKIPATTLPSIRLPGAYVVSAGSSGFGAHSSRSHSAAT